LSAKEQTKGGCMLAPATVGDLKRRLRGTLLVPTDSLSAEVMRFYDEFSSNVPDELTTLGAATKGPDGKPAFVTAVCYCGSPAEGEKLIEPLRNFAAPLVDLIQQRPYLEMQSLFDADLPPGRR
jgi:hypothetical protein